MFCAEHPGVPGCPNRYSSPSARFRNLDHGRLLMMRVLLTGGYGFFGAWIVRNLLARGDEVVIYDLKEDARRLSVIMPEEHVRRVSFVAGDVTNEGTLKGAMDQFAISHVVHLAGLQ